MSEALNVIGAAADTSSEILRADPMWADIAKLTANLGFHCWSYSAAPTTCYSPETVSLRVSTYPREHFRSCVRYGLHPHGPAMAFALRDPQPALFSTVRHHTRVTRQFKAVLDLNAAHGVTRGMVIPVRDVFGMFGVFALAWDGSPARLADCWHEHGSEVLQQLRRINGGLLGRHAHCFARAFVPKLSRRQQQILELLAQGLTNEELADTLHRSVHTINKHAAALRSRLGARTNAQAVALAARWQLI